MAVHQSSWAGPKEGGDLVPQSQKHKSRSLGGIGSSETLVTSRGPQGLECEHLENSRNFAIASLSCNCPSADISREPHTCWASFTQHQKCRD